MSLHSRQRTTLQQRLTGRPGWRQAAGAQCLAAGAPTSMHLSLTAVFCSSRPCSCAASPAPSTSSRASITYISSCRGGARSCHVEQRTATSAAARGARSAHVEREAGLRPACSFDGSCRGGRKLHPAGVGHAVHQARSLHVERRRAGEACRHQRSSAAAGLGRALHQACTSPFSGGTEPGRLSGCWSSQPLRLRCWCAEAAWHRLSGSCRQGRGGGGLTSGSVMVMPSHAPSPAWFSCRAAWGGGPGWGEGRGCQRLPAMAGAAGAGGRDGGQAGQRAQLATCHQAQRRSRLGTVVCVASIASSQASSQCSVPGAGAS